MYLRKNNPAWFSDGDGAARLVTRHGGFIRQHYRHLIESDRGRTVGGLEWGSRFVHLWRVMMSQWPDVGTHGYVRAPHASWRFQTTWRRIIGTKHYNTSLVYKSGFSSFSPINHDLAIQSHVHQVQFNSTNSFFFIYLMIQFSFITTVMLYARLNEPWILNSGMPALQPVSCHVMSFNMVALYDISVF